MLTFNFYRPTQLFFGQSAINELSKLVHNETKILVLYGGGSIKKNGIHQEVIAQLQHIPYVEFAGIEANPHYETCMKAVELAKQEQVSLILAVGGGSVMDAAKFIALAAKLPNGSDAWQEAVIDSLKLTKALKVGVIPTLAATGSEMNQGFVISNHKLSRKTNGSNPLVIPTFALMNPAYTLSCDARQTSNGLADAYVHVLEQYLTHEKTATLQSYWAEGVLKTILAVAPKLMANLNDLEARAIFMHAATMALNGMVSMGAAQDWATHRIGYDFSMLYNIDHARTLTPVYCNLLRVRKDVKLSRLAQYGRNVLRLSGSDSEVADAAIIETEKFFVSLNMPITLSSAGVPKEGIDTVVSRLKERNLSFGEDGKVDWQMAKEIFTLSY